MNGQEVINEITEALKEMKEKGQTNITIKSLENFLNELKKDVHEENPTHNYDFILAKFKAENERNSAHAANENAMSREMFKSVISSGQSALKSSMIINCGGAVALLAFISKIWNGQSTMDSINNLTLSIFIFCFGVFLSALASGTTYIT